MITREQVADLRPGDVVEITNANYVGYIIRGTVRETSNGDLWLGPDMLRQSDRAPAVWSRAKNYDLTVISRAPRPLYVNHDRTEPVLGDVVRDGEGDVRYALPRTATQQPYVYGHDAIRWWASVAAHDDVWMHCSTEYMRQPLTLLVDGETGQVVP